MVDLIADCRPWIRSISMLFLFIGALLLFVTMVEDSQDRVTFVILALAFLLPGGMLWRAATDVRRFRATPTLSNLERLLVMNRWYWRILGTMLVGGFVTLVVLSFVQEFR